MSITRIIRQFSNCFTAGSKKLIEDKIGKETTALLFNNIFLVCLLKDTPIKEIAYNLDEKKITIFGDNNIVSLFKQKSVKLFQEFIENCKVIPLFQYIQIEKSGVVKISLINIQKSDTSLKS